MEAPERDNTQDWLIPEHAAPPLLSELEQRIDEAVVIAKASEKAVIQVGAAALDAAQEARRAADLAARATAAVLEGGVPRSGSVPVEPPADAPAAVAKPAEDAALRRFSERADRVVARLRALERRPRGARRASAAAAPRRPGG